MMPQADEKDVLNLIKAKSSERSLPPVPPDEEVIDPFNPPGRLIMARKSALSKLVFATDGEIYRHAKNSGIRVGISTTVRHRHLSLLNAYDYPDYDTKARNDFFKKNSTAVPIVEN